MQRHVIARLAALALVASPSFARAQANPGTPPPATAPAAGARPAGEWNSAFTPAPLTATPPAAAVPAAAAPAPYVPPPTVPGPTPAAPPPAPVDTASLPVGTTTKETVVPGSEPHSPGTYGNEAAAPANLRVMSGVNGATGTLHLGSADLGRPGVLRLSLMGEYFASQNFPVLNARNTRTAGTFAVDYTFLKFLEGYLSYSAAANTNSKASPPLLQSQGDVNLGLKFAGEIAKGFYAGADLRMNIFPGLGAQDIRKYAFGFSPRALATYDIRAAAPSVPLRLHANLGFNLDGTGGLTGSKVLTPSEEFALGVNKFNRFTLGFGLEAPLPFVTPFLEYGFAYPIGAKALVGPDQKAVTAGSSMPNILTVGGKITAIRDIALTLALDFGLASRVAAGIPATMPFNLFFGLTYNIDPMSKGETRLVERTTVVEKKVEVATAAPVYTGKLGGQVLDAETKQPVAGAVVAMAGSGLPPVASDVEGGKFLSYDLPAGKVQLTAVKEGYRPAAQEAVVESGKVGAVQILLTREMKNSTVTATLTANKQKVEGKITFLGPKNAEVSTAGGGLATLELPKGHYSAGVEATGFLAKSKEFDVGEGGTVHLDFDLAPMPKQSLVIVADNKITIKQQVHFASAKATILGDSFALLDQVTDAVVRSGAKKIRVEGHTDNQGQKEANLKLSKDRAQSVVDYLVQHGLDRNRVESEGYGDTRPIAPNLTARGRELNRRVDFVILEK